MDFYSHQDKARRSSHLILLAFVAALAMMGLIIHLAVAGLSILSGHSSSVYEISTPAAALIGVMWTVMLFGGFFRMLDVRAGGAALAARYGATKASAESRQDDQRLLLNVVAEMSIASSCPPPEVFVLQRESSINAFVVGTRKASRALVVSQGALDALDRDALQAVVAHEFAHIVQGDLLVSMRLLVAMGALNAIDEVGQMLTGDLSLSWSLNRRLSAHDRDSLMHPGVLVGLLLRAVGSLGTFSGHLIRAAFSRQREYLADATGVQFTRNPLAMARALDTVEQQSEGNRLHSPYQQELAHLCFHVGRFKAGYRRLLASHPPLQDRIDAIEPHFAVKQRQHDREQERVQERAGDGARHASSANDAFNLDLASVPVLIASVVTAATQGSIGGNMKRVRPGLTRIEPGRSAAANSGDYWADAKLSDRIVLLLSDEKRCLAALFALFASDEPQRRTTYLKVLTEVFSADFATAVSQILSLIPGELESDQLGIVRHIGAVLSENSSVENRQRILLRLEAVLQESDHFQLMNYATLQLVRRMFDVDFPIIEAVCEKGQTCASRCKVKPFESLGSEFALLLSLMVESSGASDEVMEKDFKRVLKCYTNASHERRVGSEPGIVEELEAAFQTLYIQPQSTREAFVQHCVEIMEHDGHVARAERTLLNLFAASLGCKLAA